MSAHGESMISVKPSVELLWITPCAEKVIEESGRICYQSEHKIDESSYVAFIKRILCSGHESVLEHASASFRIVCDRGISHELVRHRLASYSQESTRYCNYSKEQFGGSIQVIEPPGLDPESWLDWRNTCEEIEAKYMKMLARGIKAQIARSILPNCLKTEIVMTANLREWRHFLKLRTSNKAHPQMVEVANLIKDALLSRCPNVFADFFVPEQEIVISSQTGSSK
jgi:thymidylate synthase (FAD)